MATAVERLGIELETIARSDSPSVTYAANSPEGIPHSATVWFAPTESLDILTFSSPHNRTHSKNVDECLAAGVPARVAGGMREENQKKSDPNCHGVSFEGLAVHLSDPEEIEEALARFLVYGTFQEEELDTYLNHPKPEVPPHGVYVLKPALWTVFDGRLGGDDPARIVDIEWPSQRILRPEGLIE